MSLPVPSADESPATLSKLIRHTEFDHSVDEVLESLADPAGCPLVLGLGVPGFGKTTLAKTVEESVAADYIAAMRQDPNLVPVVRIEASAPDGGRSFSWREGFLQILAALGERGVELRTGDGTDPLGYLERRATSQRARSEKQLETDVIDSLQFHGTRVLLIDEIEHTVYQNDALRFAASADILKTINNRTGVRIVATGSYEGLGLRHVSGQIFRRVRFIHLRRYRARIPAEFREYTRVVDALLEAVDGSEHRDALIRTLYRQSFGAVGTTTDLIRQAAHAARWRDEPLVAGIARVTASRLPQDLEAVGREIVRAEESIQPDTAAGISVDRLLGLSDALEIPSPKPRRTGRPRPGRRNPSRDLVGTGNAQ